MKVITFIFFLPFVFIFYIVFSPVILILLVVHPFKDIGLTKILDSTKEAIDIVLTEAAEPKKPGNDIPDGWFKGKPKRRKGERRDYYGSLDGYLRDTYLQFQNMPGHGYDPDKDKNASHFRHPFNPSFPLALNPVLKERLYHDWIYNAQRMVMGREFTMSEWDRQGNATINEIFLRPYKVKGMELEINNNLEHQYLIESWSVAYHEVEYYRELLVAAHAADPSLGSNREFEIRYLVLCKSLATLKRELQDAPKIREIMEQESRRMGDSLWDLYFSFKDEKLKHEQLIYFERQNRKSK